ncbi:hypothetical protein GA0070616_4375 [Micromonospora nigra]|uniref:Terminase small subunit n=1 Tax=Micromonospora nigra TaxID=145857 RepID=A0A1C6SQZ5_9ACTN|nr:hypothetical protein [Micromonospora nigra]SCL32024.1 hypothetical protein GA0070616_4375 [Micromonospora nigra]
MKDPTVAERVRRHRAHKSGDHSLCLPGRNDCVPPPVEVPETAPDVTGADLPPAPTGLRKRGARLWSATVAELPGMTVRDQVLLEEACRTVDRLDRLDAILDGRDAVWARLRKAKGEGPVTLVVDQVLTESRQQQAALTRMLQQLGRGRRPMPTGQRPAAADAGKGGDGRARGVTDLTARIEAARRSQAAG